LRSGFYLLLFSFTLLTVNALPAAAEDWSVFRNCNTRPCTIGVAVPKWSEPGWSRISTFGSSGAAWLSACRLHYNDRSHHSPDIAAGTIDCAKLKSSHSTPDEQLRSVKDPVGSWTFGRVGGPVLCQITLTPNKDRLGYILRGCHPNESYWDLIGPAKLVFKHSDGKATSELVRQNVDYWEGIYIPHHGATQTKYRHYIRRKGGGGGQSGNLAGIWTTGQGTITFGAPGAGGRVSGTYSSRKHKIGGTLRRRTLTGYWIENYSARKCPTQRSGSYYWGRFEMKFNDTFTHFTGHWSHCDATPDHIWIGKKAR
ncbi:MAG: hypothetical protein V3T30_01960, partial [Thermodesulfobacteriota bacterium]